MNAYQNLWGMDAKHDPHSKTSDEYADNVNSIIGNLKDSIDKRDCECDSWIRKLASDYRDSGNFPVYSSVVVSQPVVQWIDFIFLTAGRFVEQFNHQFDGSGVRLEVEEPAYHHIGCREGSADWVNEKERVLYEGHIAMPDNSLIIRGKELEIDIFLVPSNLLLGFSLNKYGEDDFPTIAHMSFAKTLPSGVVVDYNIDGQSYQVLLREAEIPEFVRYLLTLLVESNIKVSQEKFAMAQSA